MVNPSFETPTVNAAVDLDSLSIALLKSTRASYVSWRLGGRSLWICQSDRVTVSDEFATFKILTSVKELITSTISAISSLEEESLWVVPKGGMTIASLFGVNVAAKELIDRGGKIRGIIDIQCSAIEAVQKLLDLGEDVRHVNQHRGIILVYLIGRFAQVRLQKQRAPRLIRLPVCCGQMTQSSLSIQVSNLHL